MPLPKPTRNLNESKIAESSPKYNQKDSRPSDVFRFSPHPDITAYELAQIIELLWIDVHHERFFTLPGELHKHFRRIKI